MQYALHMRDYYGFRALQAYSNQKYMACRELALEYEAKSQAPKKKKRNSAKK